MSDNIIHQHVDFVETAGRVCVFIPTGFGSFDVPWHLNVYSRVMMRRLVTF